MMPLTSSQDSLNVRLDGPGGTRVVWALGDPVDAGGWGTDRTRMIERLLPHVRQCLAVRHALSEAGALGESVTGLLDLAGINVIHLDRSGRIVAANDGAVELLRGSSGLTDRGGGLHAVEAAEDLDSPVHSGGFPPRHGLQLTQDFVEVRTEVGQNVIGIA